jgi:hypothetical protein
MFRIDSTKALGKDVLVSKANGGTVYVNNNSGVGYVPY